ncbi:MAG: hypothetical protein IJU28_07830 [Clostridia bacterium]|nr:hypothetical protein [Clostridia bacterium]
MKKSLMVLLSIVIVAGIMIAVWQIWFPYIFLSQDALLEKGLYQEAWEKAENDEYAKTQIVRENIVAYSCKDAMNRIIDPASFRLINAEFHRDSSYFLVLTFSANNRLGQPIIAQWEYGYNHELSKPLYGFQYDNIDIKERASDDTDTQRKKAIRAFGYLGDYPLYFYSIGNESIKRVNSLVNNGKLEEVYLMNYIREDIYDKRAKYNKLDE